MAKIIAVCVSEAKGTQKKDVGKVNLVVEHGIENDAHAGAGHRQVSLLSFEKIENFRAQGAEVDYGAFGENIIVDGIDFRSLPVGTRLSSGEVMLEITQIGKECHDRCAIYHKMGDCIMPREGVFARVIEGGEIKAGDEMDVLCAHELKPQGGFDTAHRDFAEQSRENMINEKRLSYSVAIITVSDKGYAGEREDVAGRVIEEMVTAKGYSVTLRALVSDDPAMIETELKRVCDNHLADLILTTGGTGFSPRDNTPEATMAVAHRLVPGISQAMLFHSLNVTKRAMLSRAVSVIRNRTLIINLPGSPKAVRENLEYILTELDHGLEMLTERGSECARP